MEESSVMQYACDYKLRGAPRLELPENGMAPLAAKNIIEDEMIMDGSMAQNLATFVTTRMEAEAEEIMMRGLRINAIDADEYPATASIHQRCVNMIGNMWHAISDKDGKVTGTATVGSSEAIMLAALAMKWRWREARKEKGLPIDKYPNLVFGSNVQCCWHRACKFFDIECREADVSPDNLVLTAERAEPLVDEYTIGVCPILGSTFNGEFEDVKGICEMVSRINAKNNWNIPVHVDAASGGFVAPFTQPDLLWDFRLPEVKSINASGHKFGLTYAGVGWLVFNEADSLPEDLVTHVNYLGGDQVSFTMNFSKSGSNILGQYYNLIRLGRSGYTLVMETAQTNAALLRSKIEEMGHFNIVDKADIPLVAFSLKDPVKSGFTLFDLQDALTVRGWTVPAYRCSKGAEDFVIARCVVRPSMTRTLVDLLVEHMENAIAFYQEHPSHLDHPHNAGLSAKQSTDAGVGTDASDAEASNMRAKMLARRTTSGSIHMSSRNITSRLIGGNFQHQENPDVVTTQGVC